MKNELKKLKDVLNSVKQTFVGKDEIIDLIGIGLIAKENAYLLGPPGTAKSAIVREVSKSIEGGKNFEYLLTRFTEPSEIFGPFDIRKLKDGDLVTNIEGMMPQASLVFLDEIFNANSALLNGLLMALNEKIFRRGKETIQLPALMFIGASNILPEEEALNALLDRFLIRVKCDYVDTDLLEQVLKAGWKLENRDTGETSLVEPGDVKLLQEACRKVDLSDIIPTYVNLVHNLRNTGIKVSDRRAVKCQNLIAASAIISGRAKATLSDLWVMKYIWDTEEQIEILAGIVNTIIEGDESDDQHPQATMRQTPNADLLMQDIQDLQSKWGSDGLTYDQQNVIKDKLRYIQSRSNWIKNNESKAHLQEQIDALWKQMLQAV
jgi:MoxR-like ATPase